MLRVKSFDITDDIGVNKLLESNRLGQNMHILVSDGKIMVPYEDGEPKPKAVQAVDIKEDRHKLAEQVGIIEHSQGVLRDLMAGKDKEIDLAEQEPGGAKLTTEQRKRIDLLKSQKASLGSQYHMNASEIGRLDENIERFDSQLKKLGFPV